MSINNACSPIIDLPAVLGSYVANHGKCLDAIDLNENGTYVYVFRSASAEEFRNTGRWNFHHQDGSPRITFDDFVFGLRAYGGQRPGYWDVEVERSWNGTLRLSLDPDLNYYYIKQKR